ncbi:DNA replication/repair protein RecF [Fulvivirga lutimaris]|uniref:DNA replication/repair protein RecF n=1 Tax=Fulvivirga lutimaris TaxID=1819566 RepID=UPI0012BBEB4C|nr:DNA replication/repair protein RecF [Fulvivirga lutimaris]MTI40377.1 DNA replication/repair protein RecF [Fulvivirga lutimaris]
MHIEKLSLINFKNYEEASLTFSDKINCLVGLNGSGKTNILDAIYYLSMTKSAHNSIDSQNIKFDENYFSIKGTFANGKDQNEVVCYFQEGTKKSFKVNKNDYDKLSEHIGRFPVVLITPYDTDIIREGSETRRRFFDTIISQIDSNYLRHLIKYNNNLKQRNSILKTFNKTKKINYDLLENYDNVLIELGQEIYQKRYKFSNEFKDVFLKKYAFLSEELESVNIEYSSNLSSSDFAHDLKGAVNKDVALERTTLGIHKDDFKFLIGNNPLKKFGSQGQQKSFSIALKLSHFQVIDESMRHKPILLLDDIFDKLDSNRIKKLLNMVIEDQFGQVFITDAREERTREMLSSLNISAAYYKIHAGQLSPV